jgi:amidase
MRDMRYAALFLVAAAALAGCVSMYDVEEKSIGTLQADMSAGRVTSVDLVKAYEDRIAKMDHAGPRVNSVIALNRDARKEAEALDAERAAGKVRGPLHGVPILVKDNIETKGMATTAGSLALVDNVAAADAPVIARLREAGAIVLGKTNLSEWANIRSSASISGWSAVGGLTKNPYVLDRNACGSSSGSGAAAAASFAAGAIGTETNGSVTCPATVNGLVGIKPTVGLVSRTRIIPISHTQDTAGPMTRDVEDTALLLTAMAGTDPADPATAEADKRRADYTKALDPNALKGKRIGVLRFLSGYHRDVNSAFDKALAALKDAGAELVEIKDFKAEREISDAELIILLTELKVDLNAYLAATPAAVKARTLKDLIAFNKAHREELALFGQDLFQRAEDTKGLGDPAYRDAAAKAKRMAGAEGIDKMLDDHKLDALVAPTGGPAWTSDVVNGDHFLGAASMLAAVAGYPHITVPMGSSHGLPIGLSFMGEAWSEAKLIGMAYAFEQKTKARTAPKYLKTIADDPALATAISGASGLR